jgi:hypothetical protein
VLVWPAVVTLRGKSGGAGLGGFDVAGFYAGKALGVIALEDLLGDATGSFWGDLCGAIGWASLFA